MITKKQFEDAYRKFPPESCELFFIKHISIISLIHKVRTALLSLIVLTLPFIFALIGQFLNLPKSFIYAPSFIYAGILAAIGSYLLIIWHKKHNRIKNICKELNIAKDEYNKIVEKYYNENYYPDIKDYINSLLPE
jgi:hypothetical protein